MTTLANKEKFIKLLKSTNREGMEIIIEKLEELGFFTAPASSKFHLNHDGGLIEHSLNVCEIALDLREIMIRKDLSLSELLPIDSVIISSLLHDVCKSDIYKSAVKKQKNSKGVWGEVMGYDVDYNNFPLGHGEKSVIVLLKNGLKLTDNEIMAIRWHMNAWDIPFHSPDIKGNFMKAKEICPLLTLIIAADGLSASLLERKK